MRFLAVLAVAVLCANCGRRTDDGTVTLRFWGLGREGEVVGEMVPEFERRHPGIRVEVQQIPWTAAHEKLLTAFVGESTPDVAQIGNTWVPELEAIEALENLDPLIAASRVVRPAGYFPGIWDTNVIDGSVYGIPWYVDTRLLFYRSDLLAAAGWPEPPRTWAEWRQAMEAVREQAGGRRGSAILLPTDEWSQPVLLGLQKNAELLREGGRYGAFSAPEFRTAFEFYIDLFHDGLAPVVSNAQVANVYQQFAAGEFAMYITGPWNIGEFRRRLPPEMQDRWMTAPMPGPEPGVPGVSLAGGASLALFRASEHPEEAWKLIEFLSEPAQQVRFYELTGDLPARKEAWDDPALAGDKHVHAFWEQLQHVAATPKVPEWEQIANKVWERAEAAIRGRASNADVLTALDRDVDRMLEKRRWMLSQESEEKTQDRKEAAR